MKSLALMEFPFISLTSLAMILFLLVFIGVLYWTFRPQTKHIHSRLETLPLEGEEHVLSE